MVTGEKAMVAQVFLKKGAEALPNPGARGRTLRKGDKLSSSSSVSSN